MSETLDLLYPLDLLYRNAGLSAPAFQPIPGEEMPKFRNLWEHIRKRMPKKGRGHVNRLVREDVNYLVRMEQGIQTPDQRNRREGQGHEPRKCTHRGRAGPRGTPVRA